MSSKKLQLINAACPGNVQPLPKGTLFDPLALPPELQDQAHVTTKIRKLGYRQQSLAIIKQDDDGQTQLQRKVQRQRIHFAHEKHSDGTEYTTVRRDPTETIVQQQTTCTANRTVTKCS